MRPAVVRVNTAQTLVKQKPCRVSLAKRVETDSKKELKNVMKGKIMEQNVLAAVDKVVSTVPIPVKLY